MAPGSMPGMLSICDDRTEKQHRQQQQSQGGSFSAGGDNPANQQPAQAEVHRVEEVEGMERVDGVKESRGLVVGGEQKGGGGTIMDTDAGGRWNWRGEGFPAFAPDSNRFRWPTPDSRDSRDAYRCSLVIALFCRYIMMTYVLCAFLHERGKRE